MASQVLSGSGNPSYTNNTSQNVRIVINYMNATAAKEITINWAGVSITETNVESFGKNIACASAFYGDYFLFNDGLKTWNWWKRVSKTFNPRSAIIAQNVAISMPTIEVDFAPKRRFKQWFVDNLSQISGFSFSISLPMELFLAPGQTFSAVCGVYNIVAIKEDGN
jgi:hypothetical protein